MLAGLCFDGCTSKPVYKLYISFPAAFDSFSVGGRETKLNITFKDL